MSILKMSGITKRFPGVVALNNASLDVNEGEVHILVGENGAGKSTLMKILTGAYSLEEGDIEIAGEKFTRITPRAAQENGISMIYQELNLVQEMSVAENIFLGREQKSKAIPAKIDWKRLYGETETILKDLGLSIDPTARVSSLGIAEQQMVEVAKALSKNARIIIMDEPTAVLTEKEIDKLFSIIKKIKQEGVAIIYISHRMEEFERIGDRITVMRDGMTIKTLGIDECTIPDLIKLMVGRDLTEKFPSVEKSIGSERLRVEGLCREGVLKNISFSVNSGEILGIAGLMGCGRTEMANAIFGVDKISAGKIFIDGKPVKITSPRKAIASGIGFVTEDRKKQGLVLTMSVAHNITLVDLNNFVKFGKIALGKEREIADQYIKDLVIKTPGQHQKVLNLSGGNQQKVVLAKWMLSKAKIFIFDEPTRGIDVGAKVEVYNLMNALVKEGAAIIMISSDLPEVIGMSDRVAVMCRGEITGELTKEEVSQEKILYLAAGGGKIIG